MAPIGPGVVVGGRYELERTIGSGGMATVWLGHDRLLDRKVAVKILADRYASDPDFVERFRREASAAAGLSHPSIVTVYDRGEADGSYYIVMEYLPGPDLKQIIRRSGRLQLRPAVDAAIQVLAALAAAHRRDVIHRDIKPQNVLLAEDGHLKVTDFGIARAGDESGMTDAGSVIGTAQYLSPEQARGEEVTGASDCYSVGILLYEMLTGRVPFDGDKPVAIAMRQINEVPIEPRALVPQIPPHLNEIVLRALEKRPGARFRTAEEFAAALMEVRPSLPPPTDDATQVMPAVDSPATTRIMSRPDPNAATAVQKRTVPPPPPPRRRRRRAPMIVGLLALLVLIGGAGLYLFTDVGRAEKTEIPELRGETEDTAASALEALGFTVVADPQNSTEVERGLVIGTDPPAGSSAEQGAKITLFVSLGGKPTTAPDVVGRTIEDASATLARANLRVEREDVFDDEAPPGEVVRQDPAAGSDVREGDTITLSVSKGVEPVEVPNLLLTNRLAAATLLISAGLRVGEVTERETTKRDPGTVLEQNPTAGTEVDKGSEVDIVIAVAPAAPTLIPMPDVVGNDATAARQKLIDLGFSDPGANTVESFEPAGTVIQQVPVAGTFVDPSSTAVRLFVSTGSPPTGTTLPEGSP